MLHMPPKTSANPHVTAALAQIEKAMREPPMGASAGWPRTFEDLAERADLRSRTTRGAHGGHIKSTRLESVRLTGPHL